MSNRNTTILAVLCVASVLFSGINTALILTNQSNQQRVNEENSALLKTIQSNIDSLNRSTQTSLASLQGELDSQKQLSISSLAELQAEIDRLSASSAQNLTKIKEELSSDLDALKALLEEHVDQTPSSVYTSTYKSVVVIRSIIGQGSGFVIDDQGHIVTNWHVVEGQATVEVEFYDRSRGSALIVGDDPYSDIAVITATLKPADLPYLEFGNSSLCSVGQEVVAVGNPLGLTGSLSSGHISQVNKRVDVSGVPLVVNSIQLDLSIAPGSSGGPLLDLSGKAIGITNAGTTYGINFAIPSNIIRRVASSIIEKGYYQHPYLGFYPLDLDPDVIAQMRIQNVMVDQKGIMILEIVPGSPAEKAGLQPAIQTVVNGLTAYVAKDIIIGVDGRTVNTLEEWSAYVEEQVSPDQQIVVKLWRSGEIAEVTVTPTARPQYQS